MKGRSGGEAGNEGEVWRLQIADLVRRRPRRQREWQKAKAPFFSRRPLYGSRRPPLGTSLSIRPLFGIFPPQRHISPNDNNTNEKKKTFLKPLKL